MHRFTRRQPAKTSPASLLALAAIAALALLSPLTTGAALAHQRTAIHAVAPAHAAQPVTTYHVTTDVGHRGAPTAAPDGTYGLPNGAAFGVECQVIGQPTGQHGNTLFFLADYAGRQMYVPDAYSDSPHLAGQPPIVGVPMCGSSSTSTTPPPSGGTSGDAPLVWVGSPVTGTWDVPASAGGDGAAAHHWLGNANDKGDFAIDLVAGAGQPVVLYAAPQDGRTSITARVDQFGSSCARAAEAAASSPSGSTQAANAWAQQRTPTSTSARRSALASRLDAGEQCSGRSGRTLVTPRAGPGRTSTRSCSRRSTMPASTARSRSGRPSALLTSSASLVATSPRRLDRAAHSTQHDARGASVGNSTEALWRTRWGRCL